MPNLTNIYLQANQLTALPEAIEYLFNLETLDVSCNQLTGIPDSVGKLNKLRRLILTQNHITQLPDSLGWLRSLKSLHLNRNRLTNLPYSLRCCTSLEELCLDQNLLASLPNFLTRLPNLQTLSACSNRLTSLPMVPFAAIRRFHIDNNPNLSHLPYAMACQMSKTPTHPLATRNVLHISCHGCFKPSPNPNILIDATLPINLTRPHLSNNELPSLVELSLRSITRLLFPEAMGVTFDERSNLHSFAPAYHLRYDAAVDALSAVLPRTVIDSLRRGPSALCLNCGAFVFNGPARPVFLSKVLVQEHLLNFVPQPVVCSVMFCSGACSRPMDGQLGWSSLV